MKMLPILFITTTLIGCSDDPARIVGGTRICQTTKLRPGLFVRLSQYHLPSSFSGMSSVISLCNDRGGCQEKVEFQGAWAPRVTLQQNGNVHLEIVATKLRRVHQRPSWGSPMADILYHPRKTTPSQFSDRFQTLDCPDVALWPRTAVGPAMTILPPAVKVQPLLP